MQYYDNYDLIIAGTGPASTFFLKKYLEKSSPLVKVLILEKGFFYPQAERLKEKQGQETAFTKKKIPASTSKTTGKGWTYTLGFGGSSNCWYGCTPRFMPSDFKLKSLYGIADDWPITYEELEPYYCETEQLMSISGPKITPFPKSQDYPLPPHSLSTVDKVLQEKYGSLYISQPTARASKAVNGRNACCSSGVCGVCPVNAKFTVENSNMGVYEDPRVTLTFDATEIGHDLQKDNAKRITFIKGGKEHQVVAEVFALGTHALANPNILLNSGDENPMTGKCLGEQYGLQAVVSLEDMPNLGGGSWVSANGYMLYDGAHRKDYAACLIESSNGAEWIRIENGKWRNLISLRMVFEDLPMTHNYVTTTPGDVTKAQTFFKEVSAYTLKGVENMKNNLNQMLSCLPVEKIEFNKPFGTESHIIGTTRMSSDAKNGVVDKNLIHHQYRNLFVLGSGSFTTYSPANPTLTLSALSLHAADKSF